VPANGFYEWKQGGDGGKQPYFIHPTDQDLFAFAGLYGSWKDQDGNEWETYSIITTTPNREMQDIHTRMPVILHPDDEGRWLDQSNDSPDDIADMLRPYEDGKLEIFQVSREVNANRVDNDTLVTPLNSL
jgi:putative SOS response-associated peptidase YedK